MSRARVVETANGIQEEATVDVFDQMQRRFRDKGWIETDAIISINAAYTPAEVKALLETSRFTKFTVSSNPMGLQVTASK